MIFTGLDYSIEVRFRREQYDKIEEFEVEIAYWRKCWTLRTETMRVASSYEPNVIETAEDFLIRTKIDVLPNMMEVLLDECKDRDSNWFADSIWGAAVARQITLRQLHRMAAWDALFDSFDRIKERDSIEEREVLLEGDLYDIISEIEQNSDMNIEHKKFIEILSHLEDWDISLCFYNSY